MKEFIEKLIGKIEDMQNDKYVNGVNRFSPKERRVFEVAIEIVNELAEEYINTSTDTSSDYCEWKLIDEEANVYNTSCRNPHILLEGIPIDNNYEFCPYCGRKIKAEGVTENE